MYKTGRVYKIITAESNDCYVGSTFDELRYRFRNHKYDYTAWKKGKKEKTSSFDIFDIFGVDNCSIILIKEYDVVDRKHLEVYETLWIKKLRAINSYEPCSRLLRKMSIKRYRCENKEYISEWQKKYRADNKEKIKETKKQEYIRNKDKIKERSKKWRQDNKDLLKEKKREKMICECGVEICKSGYAKHKKTKKHIAAVSTRCL